jgi:hypothetical protein
VSESTHLLLLDQFLSLTLDGSVSTQEYDLRFNFLILNRTGAKEKMLLETVEQKALLSF